MRAGPPSALPVLSTIKVNVGQLSRPGQSGWPVFQLPSRFAVLDVFPKLQNPLDNPAHFEADIFSMQDFSLIMAWVYCGADMN
jgi:hypothetical protein